MPLLRRSVPRRATAAALTAAALLATATASADTARLVLPADVRPDRPTDVSVVVTAPDGTSRQIGPHRLPMVPEEVIPSPDGRWLLARGSSPREPTAASLHLLPVDGTPAVPLRLPANVSIELSPPLSWSPDGSSVVIGNAVWTRPGVPPRLALRPANVRFTALRCVAMTGACLELPSPGGLAVGVPGGVVVSSSGPTLLPLDLLFAAAPGQFTAAPGPDDGARSGRSGSLVAAIERRRRSSTELLADDGGRRVVSRTTRNLRRGLPHAVIAVGGPSGALVVRSTVRVPLPNARRRAHPRVRNDGLELLTVRLDGTATTSRLPRLRIPVAELPFIDAPHGRRFHHRSFVPAIGLPDGGWLGGASEPEPNALMTLAEVDALAVMPAGGVARVVDVDGRAATASRLVRFVPGVTAHPMAVRMRLVGYERAVDGAVVRIDWYGSERAVFRNGKRRSSVLRVPLHAGGRPSAVPEDVVAAW